MKIRPVRAELFHSDRQTNRHDEANTRFSQFCEGAEKFGDAELNLHVTFVVAVTLYCCAVCDRQNCVWRPASPRHVLKEQVFETVLHCGVSLAAKAVFRGQVGAPDVHKRPRKSAKTLRTYLSKNRSNNTHSMITLKFLIKSKCIPTWRGCDHHHLE